MTRALVVYESVFGDARTIAHAIADGLSDSLPVDVLAASEAPSEIGPDVGLLVVGGPDHAFGMPRPSTREGAVKQYGADIADTHTGLHEWLEGVRGAQRGCRRRPSTRGAAVIPSSPRWTTPREQRRSSWASSVRG